MAKKKKRTVLASALRKKKQKEEEKKAKKKKPEKNTNKSTPKKKGGVVISQKSAQKKQAAKKANKSLKKAFNYTEGTGKVEKGKTASEAIEIGKKKSALGTKVKKHTETVEVKNEKSTHPERVKYSYKDMTMQDYTKQATWAQQGRYKENLNSDKKLKKKVTDLNVKDYDKGAFGMGIVDQLNQGLSVSEDPTYEYSESQKKVMDKAKQTGRYNAGRVVGAIAEFGLGGTGTVGSSIAKTGGKAVLKEAAEQSGKKLAQQTAKNIAKETAGDTVASLGLNTLDAVKFSYEDGKLNKEKFVKELALNVGGDILIGGTVSGLIHGLSARQVSNFNRINKALQKGEKVSDAEMKFYNKHVKELGDKVEAKVKQENEQQATKPSDTVDKPVDNSPVKAETQTETQNIPRNSNQEVKTQEPVVAKSTTPEKTGDPTPLSQRNIEAVGKRKQKAYMYENPEVKPYFQDEARILLNDLQNNYIKGEKGFSNTLYDTTGDGFFGTTRNIDDDVAELKDKFNWSYEDIEKGLKNIIEDNGKENNAVSKRLEFLIDERLRNGYDDFQYGERIPGNDEYMALLRDKEISAYDDEAFNQWARSLDAGDVDIPQTAPKQTLSEEEEIAEIQNSLEHKLTGKNISTEYASVLRRLQNGEPVSIEEYKSIPEIAEAKQRVTKGSSADIKTLARRLHKKAVAKKMINYGSAEVKVIDGKEKVVYTGIVNKDHRADIILGLPASGKSSAIVDPISQKYKSKLIDSDEAKKELKGFDDGWGAGFVHEESGQINKIVLANAMAKGENIVIPKVGGDYDKIKKMVDMLKAEGYSVNVHLCELNPNKAAGRNLRRFATEGRFVDLESTSYKYQNKPTEVYERLVKEGDLDGYTRTSNDVERGQLPVQLEGTETIPYNWRNARSGNGQHVGGRTENVRNTQEQPGRLGEVSVDNTGTQNASSFNAKKPTASDVRAAYENQKKGDFTVSENDMKFSETLWKSESCTDDVLRGELKEDVEKGIFGKTKDISNNEALEIGRQRVQQDANGETASFVRKVEEGEKLKKQDFATATELLIHYKNTGDVANWKKVALAMAKGYSDAGQILQSARMVRRLTPEGRATQVLKLAETIKKDFAKNRGADIDIEVKDETIDRILNAETEADLNNAFKQARIEIWNQVPTSFMEKLQALQRMSMLGNPKTMLRNVAGNLIFKPFRAISGTIETGFQKMGTKQLAKLDGGRTKKLVKAEDKEMYKGFKQTADEMFDDIYEQFGGVNSYTESYGRPHEANIFNNNSGKAASAVSSKIKGSTRIGKSIKNALDYIEQKGMTQTAHNIIMGGLEKGDLLILKPEFKHSFAQFCYARGLNPSTMTKVQLEEAVEHAMNEAKYATFRNDSALASLISRKQGEWMTKKGATGLQTLAYRTGAGIIQTMIPFKKTPINIAKIGLDYSPLNIARGIYHNIEAVKRTGNADLLLQSYKEMASGLTGSAVFGLGMLLYSTGAVTVKAGNWSTDEWYDKEMGNQDYSLKIGDHTFSLSWCAPLNMPFIMGAAFQEYLEDQGGSLEAGLNMANGMVDSFLELSFAQSMKNFLTENETVEDYLVDLSVMPLQYASQLVPTVSSQFATVLDDWQRDTTSYADGSLARAWQKELKKNINKIPVLREKFLQPKIVGRTGEEVPSSAFDNIVAKTLATFLSTANIKEITMDANDKYLIEQLQATDDEDTREKLLPPSGGYFAGRVDNVKATPEQRTKYQKTRGKEYQKLVSEQRTAKYQDVLTLEQRQSKLIKTKWAAVTLADAKTYGYKYALKAEDERSKGNDYESHTMADFKLFKTANPNKSAKDYFNAYYSIKTTRIHAGDSEYSTDGLALYKAGADDNTYRHFGIDTEKKNVFKNYFKEYGGSEDEYYYATNVIQKKATENNGGTVNNVIKVMTLAEQNAPDRVYYAVGVLGDDNEQMYLGRGLLAEGFTVADIVSYKANSQAYNEDGKGPLRKEEAIAYVESLGLKSQRQKALIFATLSNAKNPFGSIGTYTLDGDVMGAASSSSSGGGRGNGRGNGSKKSSSLPSWEEWVKDYLANSDVATTEQPQVEAYVNPVSWEDYVQDYISKERSGGGTVKASKGNTGTSYQKKISSIIDKMEV